MPPSWRLKSWPHCSTPPGLCTCVECCLLTTHPVTKKNKCTVVTEAQRGCTCAAYTLANSLLKVNSGSNRGLSSEQVGRAGCSFVCHVPGPRGISLFFLSFYLPQQGIVSMFFSGAGFQLISASPVLFLANEVWITWL